MIFDEVPQVDFELDLIDPSEETPVMEPPDQDPEEALLDRVSMVTKGDPLRRCYLCWDDRLAADSVIDSTGTNIPIHESCLVRAGFIKNR